MPYTNLAPFFEGCRQARFELDMQLAYERILNKP